ncbi:peroxisomal hydratase-dehydrogenase-epimerase [Polyplosphaeria fusca]|uniref:Peroxisomal hydratase-dehydrogenase-epimerase n=1 Tax=Polyplosphaeria fusca TaxID=682080 RepID=A0A9P4UY61_9PLEO|nr:peroxisomal hydratase-dehydrogenase-epimerase [Polyplosphaeria fusca]
MTELRFDDYVVVVTGAGGGLGRAHALTFGSRGAKVVVNDLGGGFNGDGSPKRSMADEVVKEIQKAGGTAVADYNNVIDGDNIIATAVEHFGTVHILVNNAGILRDVSFRNMKDKDWDLLQQVHMSGTFKTSRAAWPLMQKQRFGRIVNTASGAGTYGNFGQTNYCAAKAAIIGFTFALAEEGAQYNINANVLTPIAASRLTQTVMAPDLLAKLDPGFVAPIVPVLAHKTSTDTGRLFELGGGCITRFRWERSQGIEISAYANPLELLENWQNISDFSKPRYVRPVTSIVDSSTLPSAEKTANGLCEGKVAVVVTDASSFGFQTARTLTAAGATVLKSSITNGSDTVHETLQKFGRVDIIVLPSTYFTPSTLKAISDAEWTNVYDAYVRAAYKIIQPAWASMIKNKYGRIVIGTSEHGLYGVSNGAHFAAASYGVVGFMRALFREGMKYNIRVNALAQSPMQSKAQDDVAASLATCLCSDELDNSHTGGIYCVSGDKVSKVRWQRSFGCSFPTEKLFTSEDVLSKWEEVTAFDERADYPDSAADGMARILQNAGAGSAYAPKQAPKGNSKL